MWTQILSLLVTVTLSQSLSVKRYGCGSNGALTTDDGYIVSHAGINSNHTYGKNMDCVWTIEAPAGQHVQLTAIEFDVESDATCDYDSLTLYDGADTQAAEVGKFCGAAFNTLTSNGRYLTMRFVSDADVQKSGFRFFYNFTTAIIHSCGDGQFQCGNDLCVPDSYRCDGQDDCGDDTDEQNCDSGATGGTGGGGDCRQDEFACANGNCVDASWICDGDDDCNDGSDETPDKCLMNEGNCGTMNYTGTSGRISSPNFPKLYPSRLRCTYYVQAPDGTSAIAFKFGPQFSIEPDNKCSYDKVSLYSDGQSFHHGPFCGTVSPGQLTIPGDHAFVEFTTDDADNYHGFTIDYTTVGS